jgi:hypothetical protein
LNDADERRRWSQIGIDRANDFAWDAVMERYESVYAEILARNGGRR